MSDHDGETADEPSHKSELVVAVEPEGVLVAGDPEEIESYLIKLREAASQPPDVRKVDPGLLESATGLAAGGASFLGQSAKFVQLSADSLKALKDGNVVPGDAGYFRMLVRGADGKFSKQLQWKHAPVNPQRLMSVQLIAVQLALTSAITQVEESVRRVEGKVEAVLQLLEADRAGDIIGHNGTVRRMTRYLDNHGTLPHAMWESISGLGPVLAATVEQLRSHATRVMATLTPGGSVGDRAKLLRRAVEDSKLRETLDLLVVAEDSLHKWHRLLVARVSETQPSHLPHVIIDARELMAHQLDEDGKLYQHAKVVIDQAAQTERIDGFRMGSVRMLGHDRDKLRGSLDSFATARRRQLQTWDDFEPPGVRTAAAATVEKAVEATGRAITGAGAQLIKIGDFLAERERRQQAKESDTATPETPD